MVHQHLFVSFLFVLPYVLADGYPKETPAIPFNTGAAGDAQNNLPDSGSSGYPPVSMDYESKYQGPIAMLMVLPDGHIAETAEVTAARAAHLAALDKAKVLWTQAGAGGSQDGMGHGGAVNGGSAGGSEGYNYPQPSSTSLGGGSSGGQSYLPPQGSSTASGSQGGSSAAAAAHMPYNGPLAMLMVLPDGHIADTAEVTAARAAHLAALDKAKSLWTQAGADGSQDGMGHGGVANGGSAGGSEGYNYPQPSSNSLEGGSSGGQSYLPPQGGSGAGDHQGQGGDSATATNMPYNGPLAMLMVLPSGYVADTPDIAALRAAHLAALLKAQAAWKPQDGSHH